MKRCLGFDGLVYASNVPGEESPFVKTAEIALFGAGLPRHLEIPVDFTRIPCLDAAVAATVEGTVHLAAFYADMLESIILAVFLHTPPSRYPAETQDRAASLLHGLQKFET